MHCTWTIIFSLSIRIPPRANRSPPERTSSGCLDCVPTTSPLVPSTSRITNFPWLLSSSLVAPGQEEIQTHTSCQSLVGPFAINQTALGTYRVPLPVVEFGAACHTDQYVPFANLHQRDAVFQGQNKPVVSVFGVSVENHTFWVKRT